LAENTDIVAPDARAVPSSRHEQFPLLLSRRRIAFESRVFVFSLLAGLPGSAVAVLLLYTGEYGPKIVYTVGSFLAVCWLGGALAARHHLVHAFRTVSNMLMALREGDFSMRAAGAQRDDVLGEVFREVNAFSDALRANRLDALEATALMRKVMFEIDVAVFAFSEDTRLRLINAAGERLIGMSEARALERTASDLGLEACLNGADAQTMELTFRGGHGRWGVRRGSFRLGGLPHQFLLLTNLSQTLRQEEREAWQRLVRVLGHEINNSLTPIKSMAGSLSNIISREPLPEDWRGDASQVLSTIESRADALGRFTSAYAKLARLPRPSLQHVELASLIRRVCDLEKRLAVVVQKSPPLHVMADPDQLEQLLINLIHNAVDAAIETRGSVEVSWSRRENFAEIVVADNGPGIANESNLFVPFFTTKPGGNGIGLVLSRQIAEAHGGSLQVSNRERQTGAVAVLRLPA
jgi:two-component system nitrogen regulation sensor histidine kinase NtrY